MKLHIIILVVCSPWVSFNNLAGPSTSSDPDISVNSFHSDVWWPPTQVELKEHHH